MIVTAKNTTSKKKAVRVAGGHQILEPGKSAEIEVTFDVHEAQRYEAAGVKFSQSEKQKAANEAAAEAAGGGTAPAAPPAPAKPKK